LNFKDVDNLNFNELLLIYYFIEKLLLNTYKIE